MKKSFFMLLVLSILMAALVQALLPALHWFGGARFPVLLGLVLYYALNHKPWIAIIVAFAGGLLHDGLSQVPLGYTPLLFSIVTVIAGRYRRLVLNEAIVTAAFFGGVSAFVMTLLLYLFLQLNGAVACSMGTAAIRIGGSAILGVVTVPAVFGIMIILHRALDLLEEEEAHVGA